MVRKQTLLFFIIILCFITGFAQTKKTYFNKRWDKIKADSAVYLREITPEAEKFKVVEYYLPSNKVYSKGTYADKRLKKKQNTFEYFHENGNLMKLESYNAEGNLEGQSQAFYSDNKVDSEGHYKNGKLHGEWKWYHSNGQLASKEIYNEGIITEINFWDETGKVMPAKLGDEIKAPRFGVDEEGAQRYLYSKIIFPEAAKFVSNSGRVLLNFTIEADGNISDVFVELSLDNVLDAETMRVARLMPRWKAGVCHNRQTKTENVLVPVFYKLMMSNLERNW